jgi:hypothetical protein
MLIDPALLRGSLSNQPNTFQSGVALGWELQGASLYQFAQPGDAIAMHQHTAGTTHLVDVRAGTVRYTTINADGSTTDQVLGPGSIILVPPNIDHSVTAVSSPADSSGPQVLVESTLAAIVINWRASRVVPTQIAKDLTTVGTLLDALSVKLAAAKALTV